MKDSSSTRSAEGAKPPKTMGDIVFDMEDPVMRAKDYSHVLILATSQKVLGADDIAGIHRIAHDLLENVEAIEEGWARLWDIRAEARA